MSEHYFIGIDIGTQGARVVMVDERGQQLGIREAVFELSHASREEQDPDAWWAAGLKCMLGLCNDLRAHIDLTKLKAIGVTSTSGTVIPLDDQRRPLHPAIMYSDNRSAAQAVRCRQAALDAGVSGYTAFNSSSGLPKMLWFLNQFPEKRHRLGMFIHASDYITGKLCGRYGITDYTNALKSGYDLHAYAWPEYITGVLGLEATWLQEVVPSGTVIGTLQPALCNLLGLPGNVLITAGLTDGCASQVASGAVAAGDWNTTIGTTLVVKGVTRNEIHDPSGAIYSHRHPEGYWMPGGASNTGADWISTLFGGEDMKHMEAMVAQRIPGTHLAWPLLQEGERFPFVSASARGFAPDDLSREDLFTAYLEGVAYIERFAYERIRSLCGENIRRVFSAGGGSNNDTWLRIRSSVLNIPVCKMQHVSGAAGAAIIAASQTFFGSLTEAAANMISPAKMVIPDQQLAGAYEKNYLAFVDVLKQKKYIDG